MQVPVFASFKAKANEREIRQGRFAANCQLEPLQVVKWLAAQTLAGQPLGARS